MRWLGTVGVHCPTVPERITSKANPRVRALRAALLSRRGSVVGIEGPNLVREAVASGLLLETLYLREDRLAALGDLPEDAVREVLVLSHEAFASASVTENAQGMAATLQQPEQPYAPRTGDLLLVADGLQDPGNLGTLIRSAEAFGAAAVALTPNTVDPWNGKCLRATAGAAFRMPLPGWDDTLLAALREVQARIFAAVPRDGTFTHQAVLSGTTAIVVGNEGAGVSQSMLDIADELLTIPTPGPTESLNAAVAGSLLLYEASQQRLRALP